MKKISALLLGFLAIAAATTAFAGSERNTTQREQQVAQARTDATVTMTAADHQKMMEQCQTMMQNMPMDMHSDGMGMMHGMGSAGSQAPTPEDLTKLYKGV